MKANINISDRDAFKGITAEIKVNVAFKRTLRGRIGVFLVKTGFRFMGMDVEENQLDKLNDKLENLSVGDSDVINSDIP